MYGYILILSTGRENKTMIKTYYIYNLLDDSYLGEVRAYTTEGAELEAIKTLHLDNIPSQYIAAYSEKF